MNFFSSPISSPISSPYSTPSPIRPYSNNANNEEIINKLTNSEQKILITNFYHKLKLVDVQKDIYLNEYKKEIGNTLQTISEVNTLFQELNNIVNQVHNSYIGSLNQIQSNNISNQKKLIESNHFIEYLFRKYPEQSTFNQDTEISCNSIADIMIDNNCLDLFIQNNQKTFITPSNTEFNMDKINSIKLAIPLACSTKIKNNIINYTNYFNDDEKKLTNTQSQYDLLALLLPSSLLPPQPVSPVLLQPISTPVPIPQKQYEEPLQPTTTPLSPIPLDIQELTTTTSTATDSVPLNCSIIIEQIRSYTREETFEYLNGMAPIYVAQLTHYYCNLKSIRRDELLKFTNMLFDDSYTSANYYVQKLETNIAKNGNVQPSSISIPYITPLKQLKEEIREFLVCLKHIRQIQVKSDTGLIINGKGLNIKSNVYFDETLPSDVKTKYVLLETKNTTDIELQANSSKFKNVVFNLKVGNGETLCDYNTCKGGSIPYCYAMSFKNPSYSNGNFSTQTALLHVENVFDKSARFTRFINDIVGSQLKIKIGKYCLTLPSLNKGDTNELPNQIIDFMFGQYYRSLIQFQATNQDKVSDVGFAKLCKMHSLLHFISPAIFYYIYNNPNKFQTNNK